MQRDDSPALDARPLFFFFEQMLFHANSFGADTILDQADLIPLPVTFIQPLDGCAGKCRALETKINPLADSTIFDLALPAMFGLAGILSATTETGLLFAKMHIADRAGDSAWSEHVRWDFGVCFHFSNITRGKDESLHIAETDPAFEKLVSNVDARQRFA